VDSDLNSLVARYTPVEDFYIRNHFKVPDQTGAPALDIQGEVEKPLRLTPEDLAALRRCQVGSVLECAGNPVGTVAKLSNGAWEGWSLADVLALARPAQASAHLHLFGRDGYGRNIPIERALDGGMLATQLNGRLLSPQHGSPWRALFPGWYGMDSVKWLARIVVAPAPLESNDSAYLELIRDPKGAVRLRALPRVQVKSLIVSPLAGAVLRPGTISLRGIAWSGGGSIARVEFSADGGATWRLAALDAGVRYEWVFWRSELELTARGGVEFVCRAVDEKGMVQPAQRDPNRLDGYSNNWYHRVRCVMV
jgi:DMSO/TMAO reductase YedYZ molybdopterin-dependent catalytic subunit